MLNSAARMQFPFCFQVSQVGFGGRFMDTEAVSFPLDPNLPLRLTAPHHNPEKPAGVIALRNLLVLGINPIRYVSQIRKAVVVRVAIFVVNLVRGPNAVGVHPSEAVGQVKHPVHTDHAIPVPTYAPGDSACLNAFGSPHPPQKYPCIGTVVKKFTDALRKKFLIFHADSKVVRRPRKALCFTAPAFYFNSYI